MEEEKVIGLKLETCISLNTLPTQTSCLNTSPHTSLFRETVRPVAPSHQPSTAGTVLCV